MVLPLTFGSGYEYGRVSNHDPGWRTLLRRGGGSVRARVPAGIPRGDGPAHQEGVRRAQCSYAGQGGGAHTATGPCALADPQPPAPGLRNARGPAVAGPLGAAGVGGAYFFLLAFLDFLPHGVLTVVL